jgi:hypothetical protein
MALASSISVPYAELIGAPIVALVEAEALAARATAEFIESVGFIKPNTGGSLELGQLRTVRFTYYKQDVNGMEVLEAVDVPLLSLVPIPLVQIKDASLQFRLALHDVSPRAASEASVVDTSRLVFRGAFAPSVPHHCRTRCAPDLKVKLHIVQADVPVGVAKLFEIFDSAVKSQRVEPHSPHAVESNLSVEPTRHER